MPSDISHGAEQKATAFPVRGANMAIVFMQLTNRGSFQTSLRALENPLQDQPRWIPRRFTGRPRIIQLARYSVIETRLEISHHSRETERERGAEGEDAH